MTRIMNFINSSQGGDSDQDGQEDPECPDSDNHDAEEHNKSLSKANKQKKENVAKLHHCYIAP